MNKRVVLRTTGYTLIAEALLLLSPALVSLYYKDGNVWVFLISAAVCGVSGLALRAVKDNNKSVFAVEGFTIVALSWILMSLFGSLPFMLSGEIPIFFDAFFETVSGFSTTGASILRDVDSCSNSILFWRGLTHWIGGMGVLVFVMVVIPLGGERSMYIVSAEVPGPTKGKLAPKMKDTAKILYAIYIGLTFLEIILLRIGGMGLFDSMVTAFSTAGTGGFSTHNESIAYFNSPYIEYIVSVFMLLFGVNFNLYYLILIRQGRHALKNEEFRAYLAVVAFAVLTIMINLRSVYGSIGETFRVALFQVASVITTTGFSSTSFDAWPQYSRAVLLMLMFLGACTGSTGGGIKISRVMILVKNFRQETKRLLHPRSVSSVHINGKALSSTVLHSVSTYFFCYIMIAALSVLLLSIDNFDFTSGFSEVVSCLNNGGMTTNVMSTASAYADSSPLSKMVLCFNMLAGRLEIFPMLFLFSPSVWGLSRKK